MGFFANLATSLKTKFKEGGMKSLMAEINKTDLSARQKSALMKKVIGKGFKTAATRAATVAAVAKSQSEAKQAAAKYNYLAYQEALNRYNKVIQQSADPAEGTGDPSQGTSNPDGSVYPVGN